MKKGLLLTISAVILVGIVLYGIWFINKRGEYAGHTSDLFIPNNSAVVVTCSPKVHLSSRIRENFGDRLEIYRKSLLYRSLDTLCTLLGTSGEKTIAFRVEGRSSVRTLYLINNNNVVTRNEINTFFKHIHGNEALRDRKYGKYRIYEIKHDKQVVYYSAEEGMIMISDSELYVEDALKQFERNEERSEFTNIEKYFSAGAGINLYVNKDFFSGILPLFVHLNKVNANMDLTKWFEWGAYDGEITENSIILNGFVNHENLEASFMKSLQNQKPRESSLDKIIPAGASSFMTLCLSDVDTYLKDLERYRYNGGIIEKVRKRKHEYKRFLTDEAETELTSLLQGDFALVNMGYNDNVKEHEGAIAIHIKSGGLCKVWLDKLIEKNARYRNLHPSNYERTYKVDQEKSFSYYLFPVEDMAAVYWGYLFSGIKSRYALITDQYLILASSEDVVGEFIKTHIHNYPIYEKEWYTRTKSRLSAKSNLAYYANVAREINYYQEIGKGTLKELLSRNEDVVSSFSTIGIQWSNESGMLYNIIYIGTDEVNSGEKPFLLWSTKLEAPMRMKPVPVTNHVTGEREFIIQDESYSIYLINNSGRILWKQPLDGKINSEIYQVDAFKNGKLQYLFSTSSRIHLIDRNGNPVDRFPVSFRSECPRGITVYDYDKKRDYRIFAPCMDREIYLYDLSGQLVEGWKPGKTDKEIMSKVEFIRNAGKDYIVYVDKYRIYIKDRKGNDRIKISVLFDFPENAEIYLTKQDGVSLMAIPDENKQMNLVDFTGKVSRVSCEGITKESFVNIADVDNDGKDDIVVTSDSRVFVYNMKGKQIFTKEFVGSKLDYPYVYRFSGQDIRIGLHDRINDKIVLFSLKNGISKGFPVSGDSPCSIIFGQSGDFYLFAGAEGSHFIKYRVQR